MMNTTVKRHLTSMLALSAVLLCGGTAWAKLPPLSDEAKLKADETKQKAAHGDKTAAFLLCKSQDKTAERYRKEKKLTGPAAATPKCEDPGPFVYTPPPPPATPAVATAAVSTGTPGATPPVAPAPAAAVATTPVKK